MSGETASSWARTVQIDGRTVGPGYPCFIIAEAGVNHDGDLDAAKQLIDVAAQSGADAVKFQTFSADRLATPDAPKADYQQETTDAAETQYDMLKRLELDESAHRELIARCEEAEILFLSTPFDEGSGDLLAKLGVVAMKTPSGELTNTPYLEHIARLGGPMIVSTGMADMNDVDRAVQAIRNAGDPPLALLHCVSRYPATPEQANLRAMATMANAFGVPVGYSDHTLGTEVAMAAAALGATILEKHFTLDRGRSGPDHKASLEPNELRALVAGVRTVESALGHGRKEPLPEEQATAAVARKSLVFARDTPSGSELDASMLVAKRPGTGVPPYRLHELVGRRTKRDFAADEALDESGLEDAP